MNDEIKEILDKLKDDDWYDELDLTGDKWIELKQTETKQILDYIANLQTIEREYSAILSENAELQHKISLMEEDIRESKEINGELQQENEYLKKQNDEKTKIGIADHKYASQMEDKVIKLQQENKEYKEYVKELKDSLRSYHIKNNKLINENERLQENNQAMQEEMGRVWEENEDNLKCIKSLKEQLESVINENQRLLKQWFEDNDKTVKLVSEKECYKSNYNDYKSRCEKASEYIKEHYPTSTINDQDDKYNLLNILQNGRNKGR